VIHVLPDQATYLPDQVEEIVANILLFQRANGGWPKDYDMLAILTPSQVAAIEATRDRNDTSFDNYNIHSQIDYLAKAFAVSGDERWRRACTRGFDFMLAAQLDNGGFPQQYPDAPGYAAHVTFNDGVTIGILNVFLDAATNQPHWSWLDDKRRLAAKKAVHRGVECILRCQIVHGGRRKGWCQQHDAKTYAAASARTFELASNCPQETTAIVRLLMRLDSPDKQIVSAIDDAVAWLRDTQLSGIRVQRVSAPENEYEFHTEDFDVTVVYDANAKPLWARHYEIESDRPLFAGRDAVKRYSLSEIERERRTGTPWYGSWPRDLIEREYTLWRNKLSAKSAEPAP
jgi:PelA/Pel-15E family pectate lyase